MTWRYYISTGLSAIPLSLLIVGFKFGAMLAFALVLTSSVSLILGGYWLGLRDKV